MSLFEKIQELQRLNDPTPWRVTTGTLPDGSKDAIPFVGQPFDLCQTYRVQTQRWVSGMGLQPITESRQSWHLKPEVAERIVSEHNAMPGMLDVLKKFQPGDLEKLRMLTTKIIDCADPRFGMVEFELIDRLAEACKILEDEHGS